MAKAKKNYRKRRQIERNTTRPKDRTRLVIRKLKNRNTRIVDEKGYIRYIKHEIIKDNSKGIDPVGIYPCDRDNGQARYGR